MGGRNLAIVTARGGSKRIPRKNIKDFLGKPIISYSIEAAIESKVFEKVMVSTDDEEIAGIAQTYGAEIPFMRSAATSSDHATTEDVLKEVILEYQKRGKIYDCICCLYPTAPFVTGEKIRRAMAALRDSEADSIIPVVKFSYPPQRSFVLRGGKVAMRYPEFLQTRSQDLDNWYHDCGQFYCVKTPAFLEYGEILTDNSIPLLTSELEMQDIDTEEDWKIAEMKYLIMHGERITNS